MAQSKSQEDLSNLAVCPVCDNYFEADVIIQHVNKCLYVNDSKEKQETHRYYGIFEKTPIQPAKRKKTSSVESQTFVTTDSCSVIGLRNNALDGCDKIVSVLHTEAENDNVPLAEKVRPKLIEEFVGQSKVLGKNCVIRQLIDKNQVPSMILWGPPGSGKTTISHIIQHKSNVATSVRFVKISAAVNNVADIKAIVNVAKTEIKFKRKTILFVDEIHRFNKSQQDIFLPHVESGVITLVGATTENPSFSLNSALLSRCRVIVLEKLTTEDLMQILERGLLEVYSGVAVDKPEDLNILAYTPKIVCEKDTLKWLAEVSDGDARIALNSLQLAIQALPKRKESELIQRLNVEEVKEGIKKSHILYDKTGDQHFDMISALHKSIRASDENASLYWVTRMIVGGEDPRYILRRLVRAASEDIGLADPLALNIATSALQAVQQVGMPEADVIIAHCTVYLARAPKSREINDAFSKCKKDIIEFKGPLPPVPLHLRNAPTKLMKDLGYGNGYNLEQKEDSGLKYLPDELKNTNYFDF